MPKEKKEYIRSYTGEAAYNAGLTILLILGGAVAFTEAVETTARYACAHPEQAQFLLDNFVSPYTCLLFIK